MIRYAITEGESSASQEDILRAAHRWSADAMDFVQLREKHREAGELVELARAMKQIFSTRRTRLLINGRPDIAIAAQADGVHLTAHPGDLTPAQARHVFAAAGLPTTIVSISCHTLDDVLRARDAGVDLILFGPVFEKRVGATLLREGQGLETLQRACDAARPAPVLALGGVTAENIPACLSAGADGIAAIRLFSKNRA